MTYRRHNSVWGWLVVLFAFIIVLQAWKQEQKQPPIERAVTTPVETVRTQSNPIDISGDNPCSRNALMVLHKFGTVTIPAGHVWSFNDATGNPDELPYEVCYGTAGGYWCNVAAAYARVADELGLKIQFEDHGCTVGDLGQGGCRYQVAIWNLNDRSNPEEQDLLITNTSDRPVVFTLVGDRIVGELR